MDFGKYVRHEESYVTAMNQELEAADKELKDEPDAVEIRRRKFKALMHEGSHPNVSSLSL